MTGAHATQFTRAMFRLFPIRDCPVPVGFWAIFGQLNMITQLFRSFPPGFAHFAPQMVEIQTQFTAASWEMMLGLTVGRHLQHDSIPQQPPAEQLDHESNQLAQEKFRSCHFLVAWTLNLNAAEGMRLQAAIDGALDAVQLLLQSFPEITYFDALAEFLSDVADFIVRGQISGAEDPEVVADWEQPW